MVILDALDHGHVDERAVVRGVALAASPGVGVAEVVVALDVPPQLLAPTPRRLEFVAHSHVRREVQIGLTAPTVEKKKRERKGKKKTVLDESQVTRTKQK